MNTTKTSALIDTCATTFKRSGLLRLAEEPSTASSAVSAGSTLTQNPSSGGSYSVLGGPPALGMNAGQQGSVFHGNVALALQAATEEPSSGLRHLVPERGTTGLEPDEWVAGERAAGERGSLPSEEAHRGRALGLRAVDAFLPDGGLPTGKVTELVMSGGAAWGTRLALWACRAAQEQAALTGTECWCAYIDPTGSLHARGVEATGVALSRLLVLRPALEDVERVVLRLSEARVFSVIVVDLAGVPWAIRSTPNLQKTSAAWAGRLGAGAPSRRVETRERKGSKWGTPESKRQNWPRTVRQLAMRLANTQAQVILLTEGQTDVGGKGNSQAQQGMPLPVALRLQMSSTRSGVSLQVVKEARGRVGSQVTVPWGVWWGKSEVESPVEPFVAREGRAKPLEVRPERVQSLLRTMSPERQSREAGIPTVASSRFARSSRASL